MFSSARFDHTSIRTRVAKARKRVLRQFGRDEEGGILIMALLLLIIMLVMGGMAVDFMRFESRRALLQSVSDRAVLAAAELDQTLDSKAVVIDYFDKAGFSGSIVGEPIVNDGVGSRSVRVASEIELNTFYLRLIGIDTLEAPANSAAIEGTGNIEISLVLDVSGSMGSNGGVYGKTRLDLLKEAATNFVEEMTKPEYEDQISISLIAYSEHVNIGSELFAAIPTTPVTITDTSEWRAANGGAPAPSGDPSTLSSYTNPSQCVYIPAAEYNSAAFNFGITYQQIENYDPWGSSNYPGPVEPICPPQSWAGIIPLSQDRDLLTETIDDYQPLSNTSINIGLKWGVTLLDPSFRATIASLPSTDPVFAGQRPSDYGTASSPLDTAKYLVLMTDGQNVAGYRLNNNAYDTVRERRYWANSSYNYWNDHKSGSPFPSYNFERTGDSAGTKNTMMQNMCTAAKAQNIIVYTIAMNAPSYGEAQMRACASSPAHYYETEGAAIVDVFDAIARQITDLRLSL